MLNGVWYRLWNCMEDFSDILSGGKKCTQKSILYNLSTMIYVRRNYMNINVRNKLGRYTTKFNSVCFRKSRRLSRLK